MTPNLMPSATKHRRTYRPVLDLANPPPRVDRQAGAALLLAKLGLRISPRTLETWPVPTRLLNGRATYDTAELLAHGRAMLEAAPAIRGGKRPAETATAA